MGRSRKYLSVEDKAAARRAQAKAYRASEK